MHLLLYQDIQSIDTPKLKMLARLFMASAIQKKFADKNICGILSFSKHPPFIQIQDPNTMQTLWIEVFPQKIPMQFNANDDCLLFDGYEDIYCIQFTNTNDPQIIARSMNHFYEKESTQTTKQQEEYPDFNADGSIKVKQIEEPVEVPEEHVEPEPQKNKTKAQLKSKKEQAVSKKDKNTSKQNVMKQISGGL